MNKLHLMRNPELFQGRKYLTSSKNYFEGWYFKNTSKEHGISFIPGININSERKECFIQVVTDNDSYFVHYSIEDFQFNNEPFYIKIKNNYFSKEKIHIDIDDDELDLHIYGDLNYFNTKNIKTSLLNPNIMGPFSYIPFMECSHGILAMQNNVTGSIKLNDDNMVFNKDKGYIEKDWGCSFPKTYIWCQGNSFSIPDASFMCSIADIDFKLFHFRGMICVFQLGNKEYKFTTYNLAKLIEYDNAKGILNISFKKNKYYLNIKANYVEGQTLAAPVKGQMSKDIIESITSSIMVTLKKGNRIIFQDISTNCGLEVVK